MKQERANEAYDKILEKEAKSPEPKSNLRRYDNPTVKAANANLSPPTTPSRGAVRETMPPPSPPRRMDDFRPTAPGHSPGVGNSLQN